MIQQFLLFGEQSNPVHGGEPRSKNGLGGGLHIVAHLAKLDHASSGGPSGTKTDSQWARSKNPSFPLRIPRAALTPWLDLRRPVATVVEAGMSDDCVLGLDDGVAVVVPLRIPRVTETREGLGLALAYVGEDGSESR